MVSPVVATQSAWVVATAIGPLLSGKVSNPKRVKGWFDTTRVLRSRPRPGWAAQTWALALARRDSVVGPGRVSFSTSMRKSFAITEAAHFDLRFESFNTFNHVAASTGSTPRWAATIRMGEQRLGSAYSRTRRQVRFLTFCPQHGARPTGFGRAPFLRAPTCTPLSPK